MFFDSCKLVITKHADYLAFINHYGDIVGNSCQFSYDGEYPVYTFVDEHGIEYAVEKYEYDSKRLPKMTLDEFLSFEYIISRHFRCRFSERFEDVSDTRMKKLVSNMLTRGTWLKRKDSIKLVKYKKTSDYVLYSRYEDNKGKTYYLIVLTDGNILTTIYEFDVKDLKYFKET